MYEQLITFETAKLAKEKKFGLDSYTGFVFDENGVELDLAFYAMEDKYARPTQSLLQKWLREIHGIHINIDFGLLWGYQLIPIGWQGKPFNQEFKDNIKCETYEEALEKGLQEALRLMK